MPWHILAVRQCQWLIKANVRGVLCVVSSSMWQWKALQLDNVTRQGLQQQEAAHSDYLYREPKGWNRLGSGDQTKAQLPGTWSRGSKLSCKWLEVSSLILCARIMSKERTCSIEGEQ